MKIASVLPKLLRFINIARTKILDLFSKMMIGKALEYSITFHSLLFFSIIFTTISVFIKTRTFTLFSFHAICMIIGTLFFIAEGVAVFRNRFIVESLSPIMQKTKRTKVRTIHYAMLFAGGCFMILGICFIFLEKHSKNTSLLPTSQHSLIGCLSLMLVVLQGFAGEQKIEDIETKQSIPGKSKPAWHANLGMVIWDFLILALSTGVYQTLGFTNYYLFVQIILLATWASVHLQMKRKGPEGNQLSAFMDANESAASASSAVADSNSEFVSQVPLTSDFEGTTPTETVEREENPHIV